jgi:ADP-ribose pyrophosphatase YjhB (NUDIX family)
VANKFKNIRKFLPYIILFLIALGCYGFYYTRTQSIKTFRSQKTYYENVYKAEPINKEHNTCNTPESLLQGKKYSNAGCLIVENGKILVISKKNKKKSETFSIPGGKKNKNEFSPCTAQRRTFELTGIKVIATEKIISTQYFTIFLCKPEGKIQKQSWKNKQNTISFQNVNSIKNYKYPKQLEKIQEYLAKK